MAYPQPVRELSQTEAKKFEKNLKSFKLESGQIKFYTQARERFPPPEK